MNTTTTPTAEEMTVSPSFTEKQPHNLGPAELHLLSEGLPGWKTDTAEAATPTAAGARALWHVETIPEGAYAT